MQDEQKLNYVSRLVNASYCDWFVFLENVGRAELNRLVKLCDNEKELQELVNNYI